MVPKQCLLVVIRKGRIRWAFARRVYKARTGAAINLLTAALDSGDVPDQAILLNLGDLPLPRSRFVPWRTFGASTAEGCRDIAAPDCLYGGWLEVNIWDYDAFCASLAAAGESPPETDLAGWMGNVNAIAAREALLGVAKRHPDKVEAIDVGNWYATGDRLGWSGARTRSMAEQVRRYRYLIDVEGKGFSGRLKMLFHTGRLVFMHERPWREWYAPELVPWKHFVPVARDGSDLVAKIERVRSDPELQRSIIANATKFARERLTFGAAVEKWRELLNRR